MCSAASAFSGSSLGFGIFVTIQVSIRISPQEELEKLPPYGVAKIKKKIPWKRLTLRILPVTLTYFCYGWTLWLLLNWLPSFFKEGYHLDLKSSALFTFGVFAGGVVGDTLGGVISDRILHKTGNVKLARLSVILLGMLGAAACLLGVVLGPKDDIVTIAMLLSGGFFFLELVIGPIWTVPMDIAPQHAGTASGLMNTGSAVAAIVSPLAFGAIVDITGNWLLPFYRIHRPSLSRLVFLPSRCTPSVNSSMRSNQRLNPLLNLNRRTSLKSK